VAFRAFEHVAYRNNSLFSFLIYFFICAVSDFPPSFLFYSSLCCFVPLLCLPFYILFSVLFPDNFTFVLSCLVNLLPSFISASLFYYFCLLPMFPLFFVHSSFFLLISLSFVSMFPSLFHSFISAFPFSFISLFKSQIYVWVLLFLFVSLVFTFLFLRVILTSLSVRAVRSRISFRKSEPHDVSH